MSYAYEMLDYIFALIASDSRYDSGLGASWPTRMESVDFRFGFAGSFISRWCANENTRRW